MAGCIPCAALPGNQPPPPAGPPNHHHHHHHPTITPSALSDELDVASSVVNSKRWPRTGVLLMLLLLYRRKKGGKDHAVVAAALHLKHSRRWAIYPGPNGREYRECLNAREKERGGVIIAIIIK